MYWLPHLLAFMEYCLMSLSGFWKEICRIRNRNPKSIFQYEFRAKSNQTIIISQLLFVGERRWINRIFTTRFTDCFAQYSFYCCFLWEDKHLVVHIVQIYFAFYSIVAVKLNHTHHICIDFFFISEFVTMNWQTNRILNRILERVWYHLSMHFWIGWSSNFKFKSSSQVQKSNFKFRWHKGIWHFGYILCMCVSVCCLDRLIVSTFAFCMSFNVNRFVIVVFVSADFFNCFCNNTIVCMMRENEIKKSRR